MSYELYGDDVLFFQRLLKMEGLYTKKLDGIWGQYTEKAAVAFNAEFERIKKEFEAFDLRTERHIHSLAIKAQTEARKFMIRLKEGGVNAKIISGTRTYEEQNKLYRQGRYGNPGNIVTKARGGRSNHNFGIAWDVGIFTANGGYSQKKADYVNAAKYGKSDRLDWGGDWKRFPDPPHYQMKTLFPEIKIVRAKFESGDTFLA